MRLGTLAPKSSGCQIQFLQFLMRGKHGYVVLIFRHSFVAWFDPVWSDIGITFVWHIKLYWFSDGNISLSVISINRSVKCHNKIISDDRENTNTSIGVFGWLLFGLSWCLVAVTLPFSLCVLLKVVQEYERAVIFRLGRLLPGGAKGPGISW